MSTVLTLVLQVMLLGDVGMATAAACDQRVRRLLDDSSTMRVAIGDRPLHEVLVEWSLTIQVLVLHLGST